ncbi:ClpP/crotonase-like domain-containing protein [Mycotypha africana]|uniref:ClpP/crotonase-like domain-containing protein n=1 Tax=Mycotypha africana TaxID=64632 RepID=UPI0023003563|nr:ClpP/crotonase-like domain-containing protein [Mycotypha africana]KAI8979530.1 ClpP/crotonase-like domain-containing protein [Mycotypha africana]
MSRIFFKQLSLIERRSIQSVITRRALTQPAVAIRSRNINMASASRRLTQTKNWLSPNNSNNLRKMATNAQSSISGLEATQAEVQTKSNLAARHLILNRPKKLNALNLTMVRSLLPQLQSWEKSDLAKVIILKSSGGKGFCAGGDVKTVVDLAEAGDPTATKFFEEEYQLDHLIATLDTPYIALMDGITMGGGVGLSVHAPFRVATENTLFAMPETAIGFLPEVGGSFFLSRLDGQLGVYLGLTGKRLKGTDVLYAGIATHYIPSSRLHALESRLAELDNANHDIVNAALEEFSGELQDEPRFSLSGEKRRIIDRCFKYDTVDEIIAALEKETHLPEFVEETLGLLKKMSPTSLKVTLQQIRNGATLSLGQCFKMEYHLVQKFLKGHDFKEGVTATLVTKSKPNWDPKDLSAVNDAKIKADYFDSPSPLRLDLLTNRDYKKYPHRKYMLPAEEDIRRVVTGEAPDVGNFAMTREEVVDYFLRDRQGKQGVREKVLEVLNRKTVENKRDDNKTVKWIY